MSDKNYLRSPQRIAAGLGSAKEGAQEWWHKRLSSFVLVPLLLWFAWFLSSTYFKNSDMVPFENQISWFSSPIAVSLVILFIGVHLYHGYLELKLVIEDYVKSAFLKHMTLLALAAFSLFMGIFLFTLLFKISSGL